MRGTGKLAVFDSSPEYHMTKEVLHTSHSGARDKVRSVSLSSLCGAYIGPVPYSGKVHANGRRMPCLYDEPPVGFVLCRTCERLVTKRKGWSRLLSHFYHHWRGFRAASRSLGS